MTRVTVTGGSGFIGTNLIENLIHDGFAVQNIDIAEPQNYAHLPHWNQVDILDRPGLEKSISEFDPEVIVHLAAVTDLDGDSFEYYSANIEGTKNIIEISSGLARLKRVIYTSSMYVCEPGFIPPDLDTYKPHTMYGQSKVKSEELVKRLASDLDHEWVIIRPTSIWGPWFKVPYIDFFETVYKGRYFDFGNACTKTYGYVENTVFQIRKLMDAPRVDGKTFYLGDQPPVQISEWANEISLEMKKGKIKSISFAILRGIAVIGDILASLRIKFPMTSFRLTNMTTDNILPLDDIYGVTHNLPFSRVEGVRNTIKWLVSHRGYKL